MSVRRGNPISLLWNSSRAHVVLGVVLLLVLIGWLLPRPVEEFSTIGGDGEWRANSAPGIREIVWQTPTKMTGLRNANDPAKPFVTPHLTDNGATLYFSRRLPSGQTDIFRSRLIDGTWQIATSLAVLNSEFDDLGPVLSQDGQELYFYSNRPGGAGGADIYVSRRHGNAWSAPKNVGDSVNSSADEFDPAPVPDGRSLFFASNRNDEPVPDRRSAPGEMPPWRTTLRAQQDLITFDLYRAQRGEAGEAWAAAEPLDALNEAGSSEGAAFVSRDGEFLYFASDRRNRDGEEANLDIYRARLNGEVIGKPENLGGGINTPADETEPALSPEGFTLVFSSNRDGIDRIYGSRAREIVRRTVWDTSHLAPFRHVWVFVMALVTAALLAWLVWQRQQLVQRVWPARFFLGSVMINVVLLLLLAMWKFPDVLESVVKTFEDSLPAPEMLDDNEHQSHEDGREAYEKVADLKSIEAVPISEVVRRVTEATSMPERTERLVPTIPADIARSLPRERVLFIPPTEVVVNTTPTESPLMRRRTPRPPEMAAVSDLPDVDLPSEDTPAEQLVRTETSVAPSETLMAKSAPTPKSAVDHAELPALAAAVMQEVATPVSMPSEPVELPNRPFERRPRAKSVTVVAAGDPNLPDLPADSESAPDAPPESAPATVVRAEATEVTSTPASVATATRLDQPMRARQASIAVTQVAPAELTPAARPIDSPLIRQSRTSRVSTAVASLATDVPEISAATEMPAEQTIDGTRPELARSSAATTPVTAAASTVAASELPATLAARPAIPDPAAAVRNNDVAMVVAALADNLLSRRSRVERRNNPVLVVDVDLDEIGINDGDAIPEAVAVESRAASLQKNPDGPINADTTQPASIAVAGALPQLRAIGLKPSKAVRSTTDEMLVAMAPLPTDPLHRRRSRAARESFDPSLDDALDTPDSLVEGNVAEAQAVARTEAAVSRAAEMLVSTDVPSRKELTGPSSVENRIIVGELSEISNEVPPSFSPIASRLNRKRARAMKVALAFDNVGLQALFTLRQGDTRKQHIKLLGGSDESEQAVNLGLDWLAKSQEENGSWDLQKHQGSTRSFTAGTGLGVLPFLAAGYTHNQTGKYQETVARAVKRLIEHQKDTGELTSKGDTQRMYSHGIAAIALCEAFAMSQDQELKEPAQRALAFIISAQHKPSGGWRYNPNEKADTSVVGWQMMALKSGEMAGLTVPTESYQLVSKWLKSVETKTAPGGRFGYVNRGPTPAMTAEGLLCLQFMGESRNSPRMRFGADFVLNSLPEENQRNTSYYWYYATQVMYHMQGDYWDTWNEKTRELLVKTQHKSGGNAGTWDTKDNWEKSGGRVYATSIKLLMLEVYYRHLPLYDQLEF
jgi:Tol biopolymer transport system component